MSAHIAARRDEVANADARGKGDIGQIELAVWAALGSCSRNTYAEVFHGPTVGGNDRPD